MLTRIIRIFDTEQVRLIPSEPSLVVFVEIPTSSFQSYTGFVEIEMFAVIFEEFEKQKTDISRGLYLGRLDSRVKL